MIGVVDSTDSSLRAAVRSADEPVVVDSAAAVVDADPDVLLVQGRESLASVVRHEPAVSTPVLAVDAGDALPDAGEASTLADRLAAGSWTTAPHPTLSVRTDGEYLGRAAFDAMVVASAPGALGEYRLTIGDADDRVRADGIVVATPAGSHEYARRAGGPRLQTTRRVASVVPVGGFTMSPRRWVADLDDRFEIEQRRAVDTRVRLDGQSGAGAQAERVTVEAGPPLEFVDLGRS